jgi:hypothetical protein
MRRFLKSTFRAGLFALSITAVQAIPAAAQENRVQIVRPRPVERPDTTGLVNAPEAFVQAEPNPLIALGTCAQRLRDAAANLELLLISANTSSSTEVRGDTLFTFKSALGDYAPQTRSAYGLAADELVRVDCTTNRPISKARRAPSPQP